MAGVVIGLARRARLRAPMEALDSAVLTTQAGLAGDARGASRARQVTVLFAQDWQAACQALGRDVAWTTRRANVLVAGLDNPRAAGGRLQIGAAIVEVLGETDPCSRMDEQEAGLRAALTPDWRGGVFGRVASGGPVAVGDAAAWLA